MTDKFTPIYSTIVPTTARLRTLAVKLGNMMVPFESAVYQTMAFLDSSYDGGYWDFYLTTNGGFFMAPSDKKEWHLKNANNYADAKLSAEAAGLCVSCLVANHIAHQAGTARMCALWEALNQYVLVHPERENLLALLD